MLQTTGSLRETYYVKNTPFGIFQGKVTMRNGRMFNLLTKKTTLWIPACHVSHAMHNMSCNTCQLSHVSCHMSVVTCQLSPVVFRLSLTPTATATATDTPLANSPIMQSRCVCQDKIICFGEPAYLLQTSKTSDP